MGRRNPKDKDDKVNKRKRDGADHERRSKRPRSAQIAETTNGENERQTPTGRQHFPPLQVNDAVNTSTSNATYNSVVPVEQLGEGEAGWRVSKPMGGRMLDIDPILTRDETFLILTYNTCIQVYSSADSLLVRRIPIPSLDSSASSGAKAPSITATRLSRQDSDFVWVACSNGQVYRVNWTCRSSSLESFQTASQTATGLTVLPSKVAKNSEDILAVTESILSDTLEVFIYQRTDTSSTSSKKIFDLKRPGDGLQLLETSEDGRFLVGALNDSLFVGSASSDEVESLEQHQFQFYSFVAPDIVTTLDLRVHGGDAGASRKKRRESAKVIDVIVGGARGAIYLYQDAFARIRDLEQSTSGEQRIRAEKYHWHRRAVHSVKWSRDGNYMISGGSENVLVIWQLDTSKRDFLPHLSGSVENIVVSSSGSSYVLHLDDNSTMILSTAEMKPNTYMSGIQSAFVSGSTPKDLLVKRVWDVPEHVRRPIPAASRPGEPSKLHVCVGNGRQATMSGDFSAPLLQTFDLESFSSVSKQALARTHPTDVNITNKGLIIDEPLITHISFSADGAWLASVDDWSPAARDVDNVGRHQRDELTRERHETYLKFWEVRDGADSLALSSRINSPHATSVPEAVLDLVSHPTTTGFATIGSDGMVRIWRPKTRQQHGIVSKDLKGQSAVTWVCSQAIAVDGDVGQGYTKTAPPSKPQGSISFSEDGSTIFVAFGAVGAGAVHIIDAGSATIVKTLEGMWSGQLHSLRVAGSFIIALSEDLRVYDIVSDELRYGIGMPEAPGATDLLQLAVDHTSGTFAVTLPDHDGSSIGVFGPDESQPLLVRNIPHRVVSLISAPNTSGFVALDDAAQVWIISEGTNTSSLTAAQPLQDLDLDGEDDAPGSELQNGLLAPEDADMASDVDDDDAEDAEMEDEDFGPSVVPQHRLADIFDAIPAYSAPSVEDMFYKVAGLLATQPLSAAQA